MGGVCCLGRGLLWIRQSEAQPSWQVVDLLRLKVTLVHDCRRDVHEARHIGCVRDPEQPSGAS